jgi:hypothetical protein
MSRVNTAPQNASGKEEKKCLESEILSVKHKVDKLDRSISSIQAEVGLAYDNLRLRMSGYIDAKLESYAPSM